MTEQKRFILNFTLKFITPTLLLISLVSPLAAFGQTSAPSSPRDGSQGAPSYQIAVCMLDNKPEVFVMLSGNVGEVEVIGRDATVTVDDKALTLIEGSTVYQFREGKVTRLSGGNVATSTCSDITAETISIARRLDGAEIANPKEIIPTSPPVQSAPMTGSEREGFRSSVNRCWNVDPDTPSARVQMTVGFDLDKNGRVVGEVRQVAASGGDAEAIEIAYDAARHAVLRCQGTDGYDLPLDKYSEWQDVEVTFDPSGMRLR
tara:strand:+ start:5071 stop:5853 length:783 start_codon:yes stop_codon:yes gene_type:complete